MSTIMSINSAESPIDPAIRHHVDVRRLTDCQSGVQTVLVSSFFKSRFCTVNVP